MKKSLIITGLILLWVGSLLAQGDTLTLQQAIDMGMQNNYDILTARDDLQKAENNYSTGNAGFLPTADLSTSHNWTKEDTKRQFIGQDPQTINNAKSNTFNASAGLSWTLFDGGKMFLSYERLREQRDQNKAITKQTVEQQVAAIMKGYFQVVNEVAAYHVLQSTLRVSEQRVAIAKDKYEVGKESKLEYLTAQVDRNADKSALMDQEQQVKQAKIDLNTLLARAPSISFQVADTILLGDELTYAPLEQQLLTNNPSLQAQRSMENVAQYTLQENKAGFLPEFGVNARYEYQNLNSQSGFLVSNRSKGWNYGFTATWRIFDGFNQRRQIQNAQIDMHTASISLEKKKTELLGQLSSAFTLYQNKRKLVQLEKENLQVAKENEAIALVRYKLGKANSLQLREAQRNALDAENRLLNALFQAKSAEIDLLRLSGQLVQ